MSSATSSQGLFRSRDLPQYLSAAAMFDITEQTCQQTHATRSNMTQSSKPSSGSAALCLPLLQLLYWLEGGPDQTRPGAVPLVNALDTSLHPAHHTLPEEGYPACSRGTEEEKPQLSPSRPGGWPPRPSPEGYPDYSSSGHLILSCTCLESKTVCLDKTTSASISIEK
ncbi:uncharacterized protein LOC144454388 [Phascolarctos cinereus]